jgi:hypothetical protein
MTKTSFPRAETLTSKSPSKPVQLIEQAHALYRYWPEVGDRLFAEA